MLTRLIRTQLIIFGTLTVVSLLVLGIYFLSIPAVLGIGQYQLHADLPASGGLYRTSNVTYRGSTIGKVTEVEPTEKGVVATMRISNRFKIPVDAVANVHSVTAIGEQYLDLVSQDEPGQFLKNGDTITKGTIPTPVGPALDRAERHSPRSRPTRFRNCSPRPRWRSVISGRRCNDSSSPRTRWPVS